MRSHVVALMGHEDNVDLLLEEFFEEEVVATVGTGPDQVEVINHQKEVRVCILVKRL